MSLPPAPKDISEHPVKGSVTDPVDKAQREADVDRKLRVYGVIQAFRAGRLPDNKQIDETLRFVADHSFVDQSKLSPSGRQLINDVKDMIETARLIVRDKNADELLQNFVWHTRGLDYSPAKREPTTSTGISAEKLKSDGQEAAQHLRTLISLLLTNAEARKLLSDFSLIGRDLLARSADLIRPDEEALRGVNQTAPEAEPSFKERDGTGEILPRREEEQLEEKVGNAKEAASAVQEQAKGVGQDAAAAATSSGSDAADGPAGSGTGTGNAAGSGAEQGPQQQDQNVSDKAAKDKSKQGFKQRITGLRERVPQQHRERVEGLYTRAKTFMDEEYFPKERREQFIYRGKKVILECQKHKDYQDSIRWLLDTLSEYGERSSRVAENGYSGAKGVWEEKSMQDATNELRTLLSRFANNTSMDPTLDAVKGLYDDSRRDEELRAWFRRFRDWIRRVLLESGYVLEPQCNADGIAMREDGRRFFDDKYKSHFDEVFDALREWFSNLTSDPVNERFGRDLARLTRDLLFDSEGSLTWKPELWGDIRKVLVPQIVDKVGYIPIPRAEFTDDDLDLVIENLTLSGRNIFPNIVSVEAHNFAKFSPYSSIHDESHHDFTFTLSQMQADMRDVMFYFNKKTGVPKLKDSGLADVVLGGEGITATIHIIGAGKDASSVFRVKSVLVKVDTLKFSIRDSKHDALYKFLRPLATGIVKRQVQRAFRDAIRTALELLDQQLVKVRDRMEEARTSEETTRTQALKDLFKRQTDEERAKAKEKQEKRHSQFKVVAKRDSLLLPEQGNPQGWVNRQAEREETVLEGREWRSKAFSIVSTA